MDRIGQPSKEEVREWLRERREMHTPLPEAAQIRRALGWDSTTGLYEAGDAVQHGYRLDNTVVSSNGTRT